MKGALTRPLDSMKKRMGADIGGAMCRAEPFLRVQRYKPFHKVLCFTRDLLHLQKCTARA